MWHIEITDWNLFFYDGLESDHTLGTKTGAPAFNKFGDEIWAYDHQYFVMLF